MANLTQVELPNGSTYDLRDTSKEFSYKFGTNTSKGTNEYVKIDINSTVSWMLSFTITAYINYRAFKVMVSGYNYDNNFWYQPEAVLLGDSDNTETCNVYFGYDSKNHLWVGLKNHNYTGISINDVANGYSQIDDLSGLFTISLVESLSGTTQKTVTAETRANYANSAGDASTVNSHTVATDVPSGAVFTDTTYTNGTGITIGTGNAINHSNSVTAQTTQKVYPIEIDAQGHISAYGSSPTTLSGYGITDAKIASGTITLGSNTITPLTASSTLDATKLSGTIPSGCYTDTKNTAGSTDTSSKIFLIGATSQAANPQTYSDDQVYTTNGTLQANILSAFSGVVANSLGSATTGGLSLWSTDPDVYGIAMRKTGTVTGQLGKHGYVQGDYATYLCMNTQSSATTNRGWIFREVRTSSNVASIDVDGNAVFNGSATIGGNANNTSGCRLIFNSTTQSCDFVFP